MKLIFTLALVFFVFAPSYCQTGNPPQTVKSPARSYYLQGLQYKTGNGVAMDYAKAFELFAKAADMGDPKGRYAVAYMQYKGLGCTQDYAQAASLFRSLAYRGYDNSMYFYGLCLRNGYGVDYDKDSATYWLKKADSLGSTQARQELLSMAGENGNDSARQLMERIHNLALPAARQQNSFVKVPQKLPASEIIAGRYAGYILQYDWSGGHVVSSQRLTLDLSTGGGRITGRWVEEGTDSVQLSAILSGDSVRFANTSYARRDHYSPDAGVQYDFSNASFSVVPGVDTVFLAGNVTMYSPQRKEPSKPLVVALSRPTSGEGSDALGLKAYPNPFTSVLHVTFTMNSAANVWLNLVDMEGKIVYAKQGESLQSGNYNFDLLPGNLSAGTYLLQVKIAAKLYHIKVIRGK